MSDKDGNTTFKSGKWTSYNEESRSSETVSAVTTAEKPEEVLDYQQTKAETEQKGKSSKKKAKNRKVKSSSDKAFPEQIKEEIKQDTEPDLNIDNNDELEHFNGKMSRLKILYKKYCEDASESRKQIKEQKAKVKAEKQEANKQKENRKRLQTLAEKGDKKAKSELKKLKNTQSKEKNVEKQDQEKYDLANLAYRWCYYIGLHIIRFTRKSQRKLKVIYLKTRRKLVYRYELTRAKCQKFKQDFIRSASAPFREVSRQYNALAQSVKQAKKSGGGRHALREILYHIRNLAYSSKKSIKTIFNYALPLCGLAVLLVTIGYFKNLTYALSVEYGGKSIGYIQDEAVFENARKKMMERIVNESYISPEDTVPKFEVSVIQPDTLTDTENLTDRIISASGNILEEADGLYVGGRFVGAVKNGDSLLLYLNTILEENSTGKADEQVSFVKNIKLEPGLYPVSSVVPLSEVQQRLQGNEKEQRVYTVVAGDSPTLIAEKNDVTYADLKALNPEIEKKLLPGQQVLVSKSVSFLGVKVTRTEEYTEEKPFETVSVDDNRYPVGYKAVISAGKKGEIAVKAKVTYVDGQEVDRVILDKKVIKEPVEEKVRVGTQKPLSQLPAGTVATGSFMWPVDGGRVTCGINGYWGHTGMDIGAPTGTGVRASKAGKVVISRYYGAYGRHILIDHGNGVQTLYAHNSQLYVQVGEYVQQGQLIAAVGRTGRAYGTHLHFEVRVNGRYMDPARYVGYR